MDIFGFCYLWIFVLQKKKKFVCELCPIYPILIFLLSPTFYFWHIWYTHLQTTKKKAYCYYTSLAVFRDISSRIPLTGSKN